jgi:hypothetical protein
MSEAAILSQIRSDSEAANRIPPEAKANYTLEWSVTIDHGVIYELSADDCPAEEPDQRETDPDDQCMA